MAPYSMLCVCHAFLSGKRSASGGKVSHLESWLSQRFNPRSSGQITAACLWVLYIYCLLEPLWDHSGQIQMDVSLLHVHIFR